MRLAANAAGCEKRAYRNAAIIAGIRRAT